MKFVLYPQMDNYYTKWAIIQVFNVSVKMCQKIYKKKNYTWGAFGH
jgi:hypothetical protein